LKNCLGKNIRNEYPNLNPRERVSVFKQAQKELEDFYKMCELEMVMFILYKKRKQEIDYLIKETERRIELENALKSKNTDGLVALKNRIIKSEKDVVESKAEKEQCSKELIALKETNKEL
ncbi:14096_t:CDS:2, partial [Racocetra fulgida]